MMNRFLNLLAFLCVISTCSIHAESTINAPIVKTSEDRPTVAVVLAGGGAKGVAHIPALKAIEEAGIPIDIVVGTSMGSIVGGMYCAGYSPDTMRTIVTNTDWIKLITSNPDFEGSTLSAKKDNENYLLRFMIDPKRFTSKTGMGGVIEGNSVVNFFKRLTYFLPDSLDFTDLPVAFACVGTQATNGKCKVFTSGNLPKAIRASMAIPAVFTPISINDTVYVDGGIVDNFPVDVARAMGADIVIGVDLQVKQEDAQLTNSAIDILMKCLDFYSTDLTEQNRRNANIYIPIDVTGYNAASFSPEALDTLMARGDYYVSLKKEALDSLSRTLHLEEPPVRIRLGEYSFATTRSGNSNWIINETEAEESLIKANGGTLNSTINLGGRFDNLEYATIKAKVNMVLSQKNASLLSLSARLGARLEGKADFSMRTWGTQRIGLNYKIQKTDMEYFLEGQRCLSYDLNYNKFNLYLTQEWHRVKYNFGVTYNHHSMQDILISKDVFVKKFIGEDGGLNNNPSAKEKIKYFTYYVKSEVNTLNTQNFPTKGYRIELSGDIITDNLYQYKDNHPAFIAAADWKAAFGITRTTTLIPEASARVIFSNSEAGPLPVSNAIGGLFDEMHLIHQRTMAGVSRMEYVDSHGMAIGGLTVQQEVLKNQFVLLRGDVCTFVDKVEDAFYSHKLHWGVEASYNIRTSIGPLAFKCYWSNLTDKFAVTLNAGYYF